jgi:hypothetical protein
VTIPDRPPGRARDGHGLLLVNRPGRRAADQLGQAGWGVRVRAQRSAGNSRPSSSMPARLEEDSVAGQRVPHQAGSAAAVSGRGRKNRALRSATVGVSRLAFSSSTRPPPKARDRSPYMAVGTRILRSLPAADSQRPACCCVGLDYSTFRRTETTFSRMIASLPGMGVYARLCGMSQAWPLARLRVFTVASSSIMAATMSPFSAAC